MFIPLPLTWTIYFLETTEYSELYASNVTFKVSQDEKKKRVYKQWSWEQKSINTLFPSTIRGWDFILFFGIFSMPPMPIVLGCSLSSFWLAQFLWQMNKRQFYGSIGLFGLQDFLVNWIKGSFTVQLFFTLYNMESKCHVSLLYRGMCDNMHMQRWCLRPGAACVVFLDQ